MHRKQKVLLYDPNTKSGFLIISTMKFLQGQTNIFYFLQECGIAFFKLYVAVRQSAPGLPVESYIHIQSIGKGNWLGGLSFLSNK